MEQVEKTIEELKNEIKAIERIAICESKNSEKVVRFLELTIESLSKYCSKKYAKQIIQAQKNGGLWGCYFTALGRIKATFI